MPRQRLLIATLVLGLMGVGTAALSELNHGFGHDADRTHHTPEMAASYPTFLR